MTKSDSIPIEIERKFRVNGDGWREGAKPTSMRQGYLARSAAATVRVRIADQHATLTIKTKSKGITSPEFEYEIPSAHADFLLGQCEGSVIEKTRHCVEHEGHTWEVDEFRGENTGLVIAEIELASEDEVFARPAWLAEEVTHDQRFKNSRLSSHPYRADWETSKVDAES